MLKWIEFITNPGLYIGLEAGGHKIAIDVLILIAFTETALFTGLLFSSDSFLFVAGIYSHSIINQLFAVTDENASVFFLAGIIAMASIIGNLVAYAYGTRAGKYFTNKKDGFIYKRKYLQKSKLFFEKYGGWAIISAHYLPLVRNFIPILSAVSGMKFSRYALLVSISSTLWSFSIILSGHYLYQFLLVHYGFDVRQNLWMIILILAIIAIIYGIIRLILRRFPAVNNEMED